MRIPRAGRPTWKWRVFYPVFWAVFLLLIAFMCSRCEAYEFDPWDKEDVTMEACWQALNVIDMIQAFDDHGWGTQGIGHGRARHNQHLAWAFGGPNVDKELIPIVAVGAGVTHFIVSEALPKKQRKWWNRVTVSLWLSGVTLNARW
jgi:hypothetical protein